MELDYKSTLGVISVVIVLANHFYYLTLTCLKRIRPHAFTLIVYFIVTVSVALGMYGEGDTAAGLRMGIPAPLYIIMLLITVRRGIEYIKPIDAVMLGLSLLVMPVWWLTESPRAAILFLALVEGFGIIPGLRKAYALPWEDSFLSPLISAIAMLLAFLAVKDPSESWATSLYLAYWTLLCSSLAAVIAWRRHIAPRNKHGSFPPRANQESLTNSVYDRPTHNRGGHHGDQENHREEDCEKISGKDLEKEEVTSAP